MLCILSTAGRPAEPRAGDKPFSNGRHKIMIHLVWRVSFVCDATECSFQRLLVYLGPRALLMPISLGGLQQRRACSRIMELMGIVHMCNTAASTPPTSSIARPVHNQLDMNHHVGEQITGRPYLHDMLVSRFVGASVASAVRWFDGWLDGRPSCYPLPSKGSAQCIRSVFEVFSKCLRRL